jgi:peptidoglycan hydrolase-like protein with peptidoglycan-binding domain
MMGGQMDMMRNLVNSGTFETSQKFVEMYVNPDLAELYRANDAATAASSPQQSTGGNLIARIQTDLQVLGYDPGAVNGELTTPTVVAISQFQAEKGLEVTGEATESLASVLAAELGR